jgi:hypothetical protein
LPLLERARGVLTSGTEGLAFWTDEGLSFRWPYDNVVSVNIGSSGETRAADSFSATGIGLGAAVGPHLAGFLNKLTTRTVAYSLIDLVMRDGSVLFRTSSVPQQRLELDLLPCSNASLSVFRPAGRATGLGHSASSLPGPH